MGVVPEASTEPSWLIWLATATSMYSGSGAGGGSELLPVPLVQARPHAGVGNELTQPLNDDGAGPPLSELSFHHCAPQNVTAVPTAVSRSPTVKLPADAVGASTSAPSASGRAAATMRRRMHWKDIGPPVCSPAHRHDRPPAGRECC